MLKFFRLGKTISHEQAAEIVGDHFIDVKDKLLNVLQLNKMQETSDNKSLILASIDQKSESIKFVPFQSAINLTENRKYLKYVLPPALILVGILFMAPSLIKDSTYRILNNSKEFKPEAPFTFKVVNKI